MVPYLEKEIAAELKEACLELKNVQEQHLAPLLGMHSALNIFDEFSMTNPKRLAKYVGFTESEVKQLCDSYHMDFEEARRWYDGYCFRNIEHIYNPKSIVDAMLEGEFHSYWTSTETSGSILI